MSCITDYPVSPEVQAWAQEAELTTLPQVFEHVARTHAERPYLGQNVEGEYQFKTYAQVHGEVLQLAAALLELGFQDKDRVANFSVNRVEWPVIDLGTVYARGIHVPMYPTLSTAEMAFIVHNCEARFLVASCKEQIKRSLEAVRRGDLPHVEHIIALDYFEVAPDELPAGVRFWQWEQLMSLGSDTLEARRPTIERHIEEIRYDEVCSFVYTSGTTGDPKGAMLMHANFVSQMESLTKFVGIYKEDVELSFLPLSHVFERVCYYALTYSGSSIGYARGIKSVPQDLKTLRPTLVPSVPRLFEKIFAKVVAQSGGGLKNRLFNQALAAGRAYRLAKAKGKVPFWLKAERALFDRTVLAKIRQATGGKVRFFISGGAPSRLDVINFFSDVGLTILEGYGLTETSPVLCVNTPQNVQPGTVGQAVPGVEILVAEDGEIRAKGPNIMRGYYKLPKETAAMFDEDGYFCTGDIGEYDPLTQCYTITDRKKEILILSNGKNVAPAPLENALKANDWIEQAVVVGNNRSFVGALIVPNFEKLEAWAKEQGIEGDRQALCSHLEVERWLSKQVGEACREFSSYERVRRIAILPCELSAEMGEITPTLKVKRRIVDLHFEELIESLYSRPGSEFKTEEQASVPPAAEEEEPSLSGAIIGKTFHFRG